MFDPSERESNKKMFDPDGLKINEAVHIIRIIVSKKYYMQLDRLENLFIQMLLLFAYLFL